MSLPKGIKVYGGNDNRVNSVILSGEMGTVVVDTHVTLQDGHAIKEMAVAEAHGKPILAVAITHEHYDHIVGNQLFDCNIISSKLCRDSILGSLDQLTGREPGFVLTPPNIAFDTSLAMSVGGLTLQMEHQGGHCKGESSIFIPETGTLITGDLVFAGRVPYVGDADIPQWLTALTKLYGMDPEVVIPGHGPVGDKSILLSQRTWLERFMDLVLTCKKQGKAVEQACAEAVSTFDVPAARAEVMMAAVRNLYI